MNLSKTCLISLASALFFASCGDSNSTGPDESSKESSSSAISSSDSDDESSSSEKSSSSTKEESSDSKKSSSSTKENSSSEKSSSSAKEESSSSIESSSSEDLSQNKPKILYSAKGASVEENNGCVEITDAKVLISCAGTYEFSGENDDGQIMVNAPESDSTVHIKLDNLTLASKTDAPIFIASASRAIIKSTKESVNTLSDASTRSKITYIKNGKEKVKEDTTSACIYAKGDLTLNGNGSLTIIANYNNGVQASDDLRIRDNPTITVTAPKNAFKGKGSVDIEGGVISLTAEEGAGIKSDEGKDEKEIVEDKGVVHIKGGEITIDAGEEGIYAYNEIVVKDKESVPTITVNSKDKGLKAHTIRMGNAKTATYAYKDGWNAGDSLIISAGYHYINASSDGIQADLGLSFNGGITVIEHLSVKDDAFLIATEGEAEFNGGTLLGFGTRTQKGFAHNNAFKNKAYYGTSKVAFKPSFNGTIIVSENDDEIEEQDVTGWSSACFSKNSKNCFYYKE